MRVKNVCVKDNIVRGVKLKFLKICRGEGICVGVGYRVKFPKVKCKNGTIAILERTKLYGLVV